MGEARRRRAAGALRIWAMGAIEVMANERPCFDWVGTRDEAIELQRRYLDAVSAASPHGAHSYAKRAAGYLIAYGLPTAGDPDHRPSSRGQPWGAGEVEIYKAAVLWLALREHIPNTGRKVEDVFAGKALAVMFNGDARLVLDATARELRGEPFDDRDQFTMTVGVREDHYKLDPRLAVSIPMADLCKLAGKPPLPDGLVYVPRIPRDAAEADAMLGMITISADLTDPQVAIDPEAAIRPMPAIPTMNCAAAGQRC